MKKFLLLLVILASGLLAEAQQYPFLKWSTSEGLAQSQVRCIHQDHLGYLWVGTLGGVSRFDGTSFTNFSRRDGLLSNQINTITSVGDSLLAFASIGGVTLYDGMTFTPIRFPETFEKAQVNHLFTDRDNRLWAATEIGLLLVGEQAEEVYGASNEQPLHIKRIVETPQGFLLITRSNVLQVEALGGAPQVAVAAEEIGAIVLDGAPDGKGGLLIATVGRGLLHWNGGTFAELRMDDGLISDIITGITTEKTGSSYWLKSRDGCSLVEMGQQNGEMTFAAVHSFGQAEGLDVTDIRAICVDRENNTWIGTYGGGIRKFTSRAVKHYNTSGGMSGDIVMTVLNDGEGSFWFGTYDNGITQLKSDGELRLFGLADGLLSSRVWSSAQDSEGRLYFGTSGGLSLFDGKRFISFTTENGLPHNQVLSLEAFENGRLYIGTARGLAFFDPERSAIQQVAPMEGIRVRAVVPASNDAIWVASNTGVYRLKNGVLQQFSEEEGLPDNSVFCLAKAPDGTLWAGTESGVALIDEAGGIRTFYLEGGFGSNHVNFIRFESDERVWLGTNDGVFYAPYRADGEGTWNRLGRHDGLTFLETNQNAVWMSDTLIWLGTSGALTRIDRTQMPGPRVMDEVVVRIEEVRINLERTDFTAYGLPHRGYGSIASGVVVPYTDNHFSFEVSALSFRDPENIRYQYRLEGVDDDWQPVTEAGFASYPQLSFGAYTFFVRAVDAAGAVSAEQIFSFEIRPPFWLRWWFILLEVVAVAAILQAIIRSRKRAFLEQVERDQLELRSKMLALEQQTLNSSMNRHFIFNSLNAIQYYINRQDRLSANRYLSSFARLIRKNLDSSQVNYATLHEEIERLTLYLQLEHMRFTDRFSYVIEVDPELDPHGIQVPSMLLQPFLENSIWHGLLPKENKGSLEVFVRPEGSDAVRVSIVDDGIGIETSLRNKQNGEGDHISQGMKITEGRIELLRKMTGKSYEIVGPYEVTNADGRVEGTRVDVILPLDLN